MTVCAIIHLLVFNKDSCATEDGVVCQVVKGSELLGGHNCRTVLWHSHRIHRMTALCFCLAPHDCTQVLVNEPIAHPCKSESENPAPFDPCVFLELDEFGPGRL